MGFRNVVNDGSSNPPRLRVQHSMWALNGLPRDGTEWSVPERLDRIAAAGFSGFDADCHTDQDADALAGQLHERGMGFGFRATAAEPDDLLPVIELAHRMRADHLSVEAPGSLKASPDIADLLGEMYELANESGLPLFIETCRGSVTQDLRRTVKVVNRSKKIRFAGDFSHYVVSGELGAIWSDDVWDNFRQIAKRCGHWRGRIGFGQQIQNDIGDGSGELPRQFKKLWIVGMSAWLKKAQPGDILPFTCELGPAPEAITDLAGREVSDRWEQGLAIKRLAEEAWADALLLQTPVEPERTEAPPIESQLTESSAPPADAPAF